MQKVKVITGLKIEEVTAIPANSPIVPFYSTKDKPVISFDAHGNPILLFMDKVMEYKSVPIVHIRESFVVAENEHTEWEVEHVDYIAYSPDVERFLRIPYSVLQEDIEQKEKITADLKIQLKTNEEIIDELQEDNHWLCTTWKTTDNACKELCASFWKRLKFLFTGKIYLGDIDEIS